MLMQLMVDSFEYSKLGLWESLVRDLQVLYVGDLAKLWKQSLVESSKYAAVILNFVHSVSDRAVSLLD